MIAIILAGLATPFLVLTGFIAASVQYNRDQRLLIELLNQGRKR